VGPPPAVAQVRRAVRAVLTQISTERVWVACSGGADSLALAAATAFVAPRLGIAAGLVTVDHGLQRKSSEQARRVAALGYELGFDPVTAVRVRVAGTGGPEAAARDARYSALARTAGDAPVLLGHTLDDQAETVLLGLGRGSGARSLAGMRAADGPWLRPLLGVRRATTEAACAALGFVPWDDPHNADPAFRRVRVRREVLPLLEDVLAGGVAEALARTADLLREDADALDAWADSVLSSLINSTKRASQRAVAAVDQAEGGGWLPVTALAQLPHAVRTRVLRHWAESRGAEPLTAERTAALDALVTDWRGQGEVQLAGGVRVRRVSDRLTV
jgi:tRNA(Ile)-lysidine synthase